MNADMGPMDYTLLYRDYEKIRKVSRANKKRSR